MKGFITHCLFLFLFLIPSSNADELGVVDEIVIQGHQRVDEETIRVQLSQEVDKEFDEKAVDNDIKEIYRTGFFETVSASIKKDGIRRILIFSVVEKPTLRQVFLRGNDEVSDETLQEQLNISARRFLDKRKVRAGIEQAKSYYNGLGYYDTEIDFSVVSVGENQVDLTFSVEEGEKRRLRRVAFEGNSAIGDSELRGIVETTKYKWWSSWITGSGIVKTEQLALDAQQLSHYYLNHGYADVRIGEPVVEEVDNGLQVIFKVEEGEVYRYRNIRVSGDLIEDSAEKTLENIDLEKDEVFSVDALRKSTFDISEKFTDIGYAFANVEPATNLVRDSKVVDIVFNIDHGSLVHIARINITGNKKTNDNVIRRSLKIQETELFSSSKIRRSQELLTRLGYFDEVTVTPEPTEKKEQVDLTVAVREGSTGTFSVGAGVSSGDGFIFNIRISENNVLGTGNSIATTVDFGSRNENYVFSFNNPRVDDSYWSFGLDLLSTERDFDDFDRKQTGGSLTLGYPLTFLGPDYLDDVRFSSRYELLQVEINDIEDDASMLVKEEEGRSTSSSITPRLVRNTIDNPLDPTNGSRQVASIAIAGLGGDEEFWLLELANTIYRPIWRAPFGDFVFSQRTRLGYGDTFNNERFPLFRRFFPGGINSVRGFDSRELGPKDVDGNEFGGSKQLVGNFEVIFPLVTKVGLKGVAFYDIGNAFDDDVDITLDGLRQAIGWGVRWKSPLGPIRIEIGYPLDKVEGEESVVTLFSFGSPL